MKNHKILLILILFYSFLSGCQPKEELFFTFLHTNPDKDQISADSVQNLQNAHLNNISKLAEEGIIIAAGPFEKGGGIFILKMKSIAEVENILKTDPAISAGRFIIENHPLKINYGNIYPVDTSYTMAFYEFILFEGLNESPETIKEITNNADSLELIAVLEFTDTNEKVVLIKNSSSMDLSQNYLKIISGMGIIESRKTLWIARETFEVEEKE